MIVRVQSPNGTKRVECEPDDSTSLFYDKVQSAFDLPSVFCFTLYRERDHKKQILSQERKNLALYSLRHGDMVYLVFKDRLTDDDSFEKSRGNLLNKNNSQDRTFGPVIEDEVDVILSKQDGYIHRARDDKLCHHGLNAKCVHCAPVDPSDENYMKEHNIKHMSFHAYLRKLTGGVDKGKFAALENISCKIKPGCQGHAPWPQGICTKCQPTAITLNRQVYRHVDIIMFENPSIADQFLNYWRDTVHQRIGFLYGRYEPHKDIPLGIKATVAAIYEPPQESTQDSIRLLPDEKADIVDEVARHLGLRKVGWIFTDLIPEDLQRGTVKHIRSAESCFLSAQECIMAGYFQNQHPNPCKLSPDGYFGSKFITVCVTGDKENRIHMEGYQVSNQCMALVRDNCLIPTKDAPELAYVRESSNEQYVPDVYFKYRDSYGNEATKMARPLPIEYLLVDVPVSSPVEPVSTFETSPNINPFPVENRMIDGHIQDFPALNNYLTQFRNDQFLDCMSNFHVLLYLATMDVLPLREHLPPLLNAVKTRNGSVANEWAKSEHWQTVEQVIAAQGPASDMMSQGMGTSADGASSSVWTCQHCTFINQAGSSGCEMCGLPQLPQQ